MSKTVLSVVAMTALAFALAGCAGDKPTNYMASGANGYSTVGWAYDGQGVEAFAGTITIEADDPDNEGLVKATGTFQGQPFEVVFDQFSQASGKGFQDGGIASNLFEHGTTGVADTSIPKVFVELAAWGTGTFTTGGQVVKDPLTDAERLAAHVMVIKTGVRDDDTQAIYADSNKIKYFNPANATQGYADVNDTEIHLVLKSAGTPPNETTAFNVPSQTVNTAPAVPGAPQANRYTATHDLATNEFLGSRTQFTFDMTTSAPNLYPTNLQLTVKTPSGAVLDTVPAGESMSDVQSIPFAYDLAEVGTYTLEVVGDGVQAEYTIDGTLTPPPSIVWNFWWEDVTLGSLEPASASDTMGEMDHGTMGTTATLSSR